MSWRLIEALSDELIPIHQQLMRMMQVAGGGCHDAWGIAFTGSGKTLVSGALVRSRIPSHVADGHRNLRLPGRNPKWLQQEIWTLNSSTYEYWSVARNSTIWAWINICTWNSSKTTCTQTTGISKQTTCSNFDFHNDQPGLVFQWSCLLWNKSFGQKYASQCPDHVSLWLLTWQFLDESGWMMEYDAEAYETSS